MTTPTPPAENAAKKDKTWKYAPLGERLTETAVSVGSAALYGLALTQIFNPVALGIAAGYGVARTAWTYYDSHGDRAREKAIREGYFAPLPEKYAKLQKVTDEMTDAAGMPRHHALLATPKITRMIVPWYLRFVLLVPEIKKKALQSTAAAVSSMDTVIATPEFMELADDRELRFVIAHEVSHAKVEDSYSAKNIAKSLKKHTQVGLIAGLALTAGAGLLGMTALPAVLAGGTSVVGGALMLGIVSAVANLGLNYANRIVERRADRNAIHLTRDPEAAESFFIKASPKGKTPSPSILPETSSHPSFHPRMENIRAAFNHAAAYPAPPTARMQAAQTARPERSARWVEPK
jgi:hypothetical protein